MNKQGTGMGAHAGMAVDHHVGQEFHPVFQADVRADDAEGADFDPRADIGVRMDLRRGMNVGHFCLTIMAENTASALVTPSATALPLNFHTSPRFWMRSTWICTQSPGTTGLRNRALSTVMK